MQIVARTLMPETYEGQSLGGQERHVVLVDTDSRVSVRRIAEIIRHNAQQSLPTAPDAFESLVRECLSHLEVVSCSDSEQLLLALHSLATTAIRSCFAAAHCRRK